MGTEQMVTVTYKLQHITGDIMGMQQMVMEPITIMANGCHHGRASMCHFTVISHIAHIGLRNLQNHEPKHMTNPEISKVVMDRILAGRCIA